MKMVAEAGLPNPVRRSGRPNGRRDDATSHVRRFERNARNAGGIRRGTAGGNARAPKADRTPPLGLLKGFLNPRRKRTATDRRPLRRLRPGDRLAQWRDLLGWEDLAWEFHPAENRRLPVDLKTSRGQTLAGSGGKVLEAFEYLFNLVSSGGDREKPWVSFRVAGFPSADESRLVDQALFAAFQVRRTGKMFRMDPMPPAHRRAVHQTLANHPDVETFSEGEGPLRLVVVKPKEKKE